MPGAGGLAQSLQKSLPILYSSAVSCSCQNDALSCSISLGLGLRLALRRCLTCSLWEGCIFPEMLAGPGGAVVLFVTGFLFHPCRYSYMIDNVILLITGTLHQRSISELVPKCHPLGSFEQMEAVNIAQTPAELYNAILVDTPLGEQKSLCPGGPSSGLLPAVAAVPMVVGLELTSVPVLFQFFQLDHWVIS